MHRALSIAYAQQTSMEGKEQTVRSVVAAFYPTSSKRNWRKEKNNTHAIHSEQLFSRTR